MTYAEIIYLVLDLSKLLNDDITINEDHVLFLVSKVRAQLLWQKYKSQKLEVPESNYQTLCLSLKSTSPISGEPCEGTNYLISEKTVPVLMEIGNTVIYPLDFYQGINICIIPRERMRYTGDNKYLRNIIYCSIGPNGALTFKSNNPQFQYLQKVKLTGVFEDVESASKLACDGECNLMDKVFPLEESLVPALLDIVVKEVVGAAWRPADTQNAANDELSDMASFIARNTKKSFQKQIN